LNGSESSLNTDWDPINRGFKLGFTEEVTQMQAYFENRTGDFEKESEIDDIKTQVQDEHWGYADISVEDDLSSEEEGGYEKDGNMNSDYTICVPTDRGREESPAGAITTLPAYFNTDFVSDTALNGASNTEESVHRGKAPSQWI